MVRTPLLVASPELVAAEANVPLLAITAALQLKFASNMLDFVEGKHNKRKIKCHLPLN